MLNRYSGIRVRVSPEVRPVLLASLVTHNLDVKDKSDGDMPTPTGYPPHPPNTAADTAHSAHNTQPALLM